MCFFFFFCNLTIAFLGEINMNRSTETLFQFHLIPHGILFKPWRGLLFCVTDETKIFSPYVPRKLVVVRFIFCNFFLNIFDVWTSPSLAVFSNHSATQPFLDCNIEGGGGEREIISFSWIILKIFQNFIYIKLEYIRKNNYLVEITFLSFFFSFFLFKEIKFLQIFIQESELRVEEVKRQTMNLRKSF